MLPGSFKTEKEFKNYLCCLKKIKYGDKAIIYINMRQNGDGTHSRSPSFDVTNYYVIVDIIGKVEQNNFYYPILGADDIQRFWDGDYKYNENTYRNFHNYKKRYWAIPRDVRIKRIIKA